MRVYTSYDLEICYGEDELKEIHNIDITKGIINLDEVKDLNYTEIYLITIIKDKDNNIIKRSQCRII